MAYCTNCGNQLRDGAKFCDNCGFQVGESDFDSKRQTVFEGKIHKCPNCGEIVEAFQDDCPACGYQFRDTKANSSVKELSDKLEQISNLSIGEKDKNSRKVSLISSFAIPNTAEDLWEFIILSSSNINMKFDPDGEKDSENALSDAWRAKFDQAYQKSKLVIDEPSQIKQIDKIHAKVHSKIKRYSIISYVYYGVLITICAVIMIPVMYFTFTSIDFKNIFSQSNIQSENNRLNAIVAEVNDCIESGNYTLARTKAATLVFKYSSDKIESDDEARQQWDKTREDLLEIIDEAEQESKKQVNTGGK